MSFRFTPIRTSPGPSITSCPLNIIVKNNSGNSTVSITAGTVNNLLPSNIFVAGGFPINSKEVVYVKINALTDGHAVTSCSIVIDSNVPDIQQPTPFGLPQKVDILIGVISYGTPYRTIGCGSIQLTGQQQFIINKDPPAQPGTLNYIPYYTWVVGTI